MVMPLRPFVKPIAEEQEPGSIWRDIPDEKPRVQGHGKEKSWTEEENV